MFGVIPQRLGTGEKILPFPTIESDEPEFSRTQRFLLKAGAVMVQPKNAESNAVKINPTVVSLVVTLFGVLVVLGGFVYNYAVFSTSFENEKKKWEVLEKRLENIEKIQREQEIKKAEINGYQIGKTEGKR